MSNDISNRPLAPEPDHAELANSHQPARFWLRVAAKMVDSLVAVLGMGTLLTMLVALLHMAGLDSLLLLWLFVAASLLLPIVYFAYFNSAGRQTLGYRLAGIHVETVTHEPVGWWRSLGRATLGSLFQLATIIFIGLADYLPIAFTRSKRALHDYVTGTQVVRVAAPQMNTLIICAVAFPVLALGLRPFHLFLQAYYIPSGAMENTLHINDRLLVHRLYYRLSQPQFQDVIVFRAPRNIGVGPGIDFIKRCIGVPGDVIYSKGRHYYRNGRLIEEPYVKWSADPYLSHAYDMKIVRGLVYSREYEAPDLPGPWRVNGVPVPEGEQKKISLAAPESVPPHYFLMLGDYRNNSNDGHVWGLVHYDELLGKAMFIYWPPEHLHEL